MLIGPSYPTTKLQMNFFNLEFLTVTLWLKIWVIINEISDNPQSMTPFVNFSPTFNDKIIPIFSNTIIRALYISKTLNVP